MANMVNIDGKEYEELTYTQTGYTVATKSAQLAVNVTGYFSEQEKYIVKIATRTQLTAISLVVNIVKTDGDLVRAVTKTSGGLVAGLAYGTVDAALTAFAAGLLGTVTAPVAIGIGVVGIVGGGIASYYGSETADKLLMYVREMFGSGEASSDDIKVELDKNNNTTISTTNSLQTFLDNDSSLLATLGANDNWDIHATIPSVSNPEYFVEQLAYNNNTKQAIIKTNDNDNLDDYVTRILENTPAQKITLNTQTYNIKSSNNNLLVRNAIDNIPTVSFLLSQIDIKAGEILDIGNQGLYTIKGGDTMSQIAETKGMTTQALLKLNTWLIDKGRVSFNQDKILIETDASNLTNKDHTYQGTSAEDRLIDLNGGFDTYITNNNDTIKDNDGKGRVLFNGNLLSGGIWNKDKGVYEGDGGEYIQTSNGWKFVSSNAEVLNFNMDIKDSLGIKLKKDDEPPKDDEPILPEDFSSPLILDLNRDGKLSTTLFNSKTYFDMDSDGFREKTAWVQKGDGLLALDINGNGKIDNGSELFGNYTNLKDNTKAKDGFEALLQHDENHDGVIDKNDSIYSKLKVWLDENQNGKTDEGELKSLNEAGVTTVKLNPYQTLLSLLDDNSDGVLNDKDTIYSKIMVKTNEDGTKSLIIPTKKKKVALGITLQESADIEASVLNDDQALEAQEIMRFNVGLDRELLTGEEVVKLGYNRHNYRKNEIKKEVAW